MIPKVEQSGAENTPKGELIPWTLKLGRKAARVNRWEQQWYKQWGLSQECSICGANHTAMVRQVDEDYKTSYVIKCPVASNEQWPPIDDDGGNQSIWDSLEASSRKMASYHDYSHEAITGALQKWEHYGAGNRMSLEERDLFKAEVDLWCMMERQTWTFKRTLLIIPEKDDELQNILREIGDEEG